MPRIEQAPLDVSALRGMTLSPELEAKLKAYLEEDLGERIAKREKDKEKERKHQVAKVEMAKTNMAGKRRQQATCGHRATKKNGGGISGQKISSGQVAHICLVCHKVFHEPPDTSLGQVSLPRELVSEIDPDTYGG